MTYIDELRTRWPDGEWRYSRGYKRQYWTGTIYGKPAIVTSTWHFPVHQDKEETILLFCVEYRYGGPIGLGFTPVDAVAQAHTLLADVPVEATSALAP